MLEKFQKLFAYNWIFLIIYFLLSTLIVAITGNWKSAPFFMGSYVILVSISGLMFLPFLWLAYTQKNLSKSTKVTLIIFLGTIFLTFLFFGVVILINSSNVNLLLKVISLGGISLITYGVVGIVTKEIILIIPFLTVRTRLIHLLGIKARLVGLIYSIIGILIFVSFIFII